MIFPEYTTPIPIPTKERRLKSLSNKIDFYTMEIMSYEKLPNFKDEEVTKDIVKHLKVRIAELLIVYKKELNNDSR